LEITGRRDRAVASLSAQVKQLSAYSLRHLAVSPQQSSFGKVFPYWS
jgi:hypothetical protein